jgi:hypothetical protein
VVSLIAQTGQSEAIHFPEECASTVVKFDDAGSLVDRRGLHGRDLMLLAHDVEPARQRGIAERPFGLARAIWPDGRHEGLLRIGQLRLRPSPNFSLSST